MTYDVSEHMKIPTLFIVFISGFVLVGCGQPPTETQVEAETESAAQPVFLDIPTEGDDDLPGDASESDQTRDVSDGTDDGSTHSSAPEVQPDPIGIQKPTDSSKEAMKESGEKGGTTDINIGVGE